ncbi:MAG: hypothetical protein M1274_12080 [Actinobacteria bacterium]|nr:hypothetical protein [Actinomycetota bacterium]
MSCPQCGAPVWLPHDADFTQCTSCGSVLAAVQGVLAHVLREEVRVTREQAAGILEAWLSGEGYDSADVTPAGKKFSAPIAAPVVDELHLFPFMRVKGEADERITPLGALPSPAVAQFGYAPGELVEATLPLKEIDQATLGSAVAAALAEPRITAVQVEMRGYYPAQYALVGDGVATRYSVAIGAGQGAVYPDSLPPRSPHAARSPQWYLLGLAVALVAEAVAIPELWPAILAIVATATVFCAAFCGAEARRA